ncbi:MAG: hypothetical protein M0Z39_06605 [Actinomycetota bacterium]|jgi:hypothetical protein|nr:hypothetical protein [Actinomycetota bacterium]
MSVEQKVPRSRRKRSWRWLAAIVIVPLTLLGTLVLSAPAYALTLSGNDAPAVQKLSMYSDSMLLMNLPTEYDVVPGTAGPTNIPDQVVSSNTTYQKSYTPERIPVSFSGSGYAASLSQLPIIDPCPLGDCLPQTKPYQVPIDGGASTGTVYPGPSGPCASLSSVVCASGNIVIVPAGQLVPAPSSAQGNSPQYVTVQVPHVKTIITTVTDQNIHIANAKLLSVQPEIIGINTNTSRAEGLNLQGPACSTPTTPLWNPVTHTMPYDYSLHPWLYSQYWTNLGICNISPAFLNTSIFNSWLSVAGKVQFNIAPYWQLTASYNQVTTVNGGVTNSVPSSSVQNVLAPWYYGPVLPVRAITAVPCKVTNGVSICPNGQTSPMPQ